MLLNIKKYFMYMVRRKMMYISLLEISKAKYIMKLGQGRGSFRGVFINQLNL